MGKSGGQIILRSVFFLFILLSLPVYIHAQILKKHISVSFYNVSIQEGLHRIQSQYDIRFSYPGNLPGLERKISLQTSGEVKQVLGKILKGTDISFIEVGKYIVLRENKKALEEQGNRNNRPSANDEKKQKEQLPEDNEKETGIDEKGTRPGASSQPDMLQKNEVGGGIQYSIGDRNLAIHLRWQKRLNADYRIVPEIEVSLVRLTNWTSEKNDVPLVGVNINVHRVFQLKDYPNGTLKAYPLLGLNTSFFHYKPYPSPPPADSTDFWERIKKQTKGKNPLKNADKEKKDDPDPDEPVQPVEGGQYAVGINIGGGLQFTTNTRWAYLFETKYILGLGNRIYFKAGLIYKL